MKLPKTPLPLAALLLLTTALPSQAQQPRPPQSPADMLQKQTNGPQWKNDYTGESFCWQTVYSMNDFLRAYNTTKNTAYLDAAVTYFDAILAKMAAGPDGYKGFIGPFIYSPKAWCDVHVGDALIFDGILNFSLTIARDPNLKQKYGEKALAYVEHAKKDFFEKWDARGTWHDEGPQGYYVSWNQYCQPGQLKTWGPNPEMDKEADETLPFNKQIDCGVLAIRIWQITGDEKFKHRAEQIFGFMKARMQNYNGALHWNYTEPAGPWDFKNLEKNQWDPRATNKDVAHWIGVHPERNYQTGEVDNIVTAYNAGIVFTEADIKAIIHTNLKVMWNGDLEKPLFANSTIDLLQQTGKTDLYHPSDAPDKAGELWTTLAQFDPQARALSRRHPAADEPPPSFDRKDAKNPVQIPPVYAQFPLGNTRIITMACVMPAIFRAGENAIVACKISEAAELEVALYSADGKTPLATFKKSTFNGGPSGREGIVYFLFNGTLPDHQPLAPGNYRIRWTTTHDGYREFPFTLQPKK